MPGSSSFDFRELSAGVNVGEEAASAREDLHDYLLCKSKFFAARRNLWSVGRRSMPSSRPAATRSTRSPSTMGAGSTRGGDWSQPRADRAAPTPDSGGQITHCEAQSTQGF